MAKSAQTDRQKASRNHTIATVVAAMAFIVAHLRFFDFADLPRMVHSIGYLVMLMALIVVFRTRNADEFIAAVWQRSTNVAFIAIVLLLAFTPFLEGFWDGLFGNESRYDLNAERFGTPLALISFFIANLWVRIRGTI